MTKYTLNDLENGGKNKDGEKHYLIDGILYSESEAKDLLVICNYTGELTPVVTTKTIANLIRDIQELKEANE